MQAGRRVRADLHAGRPRLLRRCADERGLPDPQRLAPRRRQARRQAAGDGLDLRRRLHPRRQLDAVLRRHPLRRGTASSWSASTTGSAASASSPTRRSTAEPSPFGNYGLMDQIAALKWVKANIAGLRRRSAQRHRVRRERRGDLGQLPDGLAGRQGPVRQGDRRIRLRPLRAAAPDRRALGRGDRDRVRRGARRQGRRRGRRRGAAGAAGRRAERPDRRARRSHPRRTRCSTAGSSPAASPRRFAKRRRGARALHGGRQQLRGQPVPAPRRRPGPGDRPRRRSGQGRGGLRRRSRPPRSPASSPPTC